MRPLHANRQMGDTFDIEPQDIYLYMNELASLVALEKLTLLEFQKLGTYLCPSLPLATRARHRADAAGEVIYYCQNGLPEVMTGDFISAGPVLRFVCMRRAFFSPFFFFSLIGTPSGDRHDISVHSPAHFSAVRARRQGARKFSSFDHIHLSRKWKVRPSEPKTRKFCSMS